MAEVPVSCQQFSPTCVSMQGINQILNDGVIENDLLLCPGNNQPDGWIRLAVTGLAGLENLFGVVAFSEDDESTFGFIRNMHAQGAEVVPTPEPTPTPTPSPTPTPDGSGGPTPTGGGTPGGGGGGGSGCAIAGPAQAGTAAANALIVLLPGAAFALRRRFAK